MNTSNIPKRPLPTKNLTIHEEFHGTKEDIAYEKEMWVLIDAAKAANDDKRVSALKDALCGVLS